VGVFIHPPPSTVLVLKGGTSTRKGLLQLSPMTSSNLGLIQGEPCRTLCSRSVARS
jgi:hypothetical protein